MTRTVVKQTVVTETVVTQTVVTLFLTGDSFDSRKLVQLFVTKKMIFLTKVAT